ncbi:hypothetical protein Z043_119979 [Scleropages formosus]|uniref:Teneurin-1-4-like galactose-binding domain-containing protein n=1 Tax=Scleropages formosus TaxID=113540 RepID=A0A0P7UK85_SCLFO|nr:hypothetical protein Z043_119979 [Scleropages formosus]
MAINLLGLNWRLQPADGHLISNRLSTQLPGNSYVATLPSGGRGKNGKWLLVRPVAEVSEDRLGWSFWVIPLTAHCTQGPWPLRNTSIDTGELEVGRRITQEVPPGVFWRSLLHLSESQFLKFNISLSKDALFGVYIRKGLPPSHAQVPILADPIVFLL